MIGAAKPLSVGRRSKKSDGWHKSIHNLRAGLRWKHSLLPDARLCLIGAIETESEKRRLERELNTKYRADPDLSRMTCDIMSLVLAASENINFYFMV